MLGDQAQQLVQEARLSKETGSLRPYKCVVCTGGGGG